MLNIVKSYKNCKRSEEQHYCRLIAKSNNKIKATWNIMKKNRKGTFSGTGSHLTVNDEKFKGSNRRDQCLQ